MSGRPHVSGAALKIARRFLVLLAGASLAASLAWAPASASLRHRHWHHWHHWHAVRPVLRLTDPAKDAALIVDGETGKVLYARNADALRHPASLTKMMTLYLLFGQLKSGQMTLATPLTVSAHAASQAPVKLYFRPGTTISVEDAIKAIVVLSANDVAVAIAENIGGSEGHFAEMMTAKARSWGMSHTFYHNASGLPDPLQITTAGDLSILARHLAYDFPQYFHYFSTYSFTYRGVTHYTHDNLIGRYEGADGIKTGYTNASGFNLVSSVVRNGAHIIGVVMGGTTARRRDSEMVQLLDNTFAAIGRNPELVARETVPWQAIAQNGAARPVIAGFPFGTGVAKPPALPAAPKLASEQVQVSLGEGDDEDTAESRPDPAYDPLVPQLQAAPLRQRSAEPAHPAPSTLVTASLEPATVRPLSAPTPQQRPAHPASSTVVTASLEPATLRPLPAVQAMPTTANRAGELQIPDILRGSVPVPQPKPAMGALAVAPAPEITTDVGKWAIQIGAFGDASLAHAELANYAARSGDVLGRAPRIVAPFHNAEGHTLYRARFGPFPERQARHVCQVLTGRGETCFAALAER
ncbi:MAG: serine hydrolase [Rhizomicrobium sp.]